ncbi:hypothetical protein SAMN05892877_103413 [Rhizobium subbaraonis]|uniref:Uncharacterized protein n=1 Tax=Rhizobium subbaraonis TaxID=908946 RepID=A0A285U5F6_9HYPH|nr:hypothetical protein SAMN05892877_103413 [Rhizobium subbaraonis]
MTIEQRIKRNEEFIKFHRELSDISAHETELV